MLPNGLGDLGNDGGCSRGRAGAARLAPKLTSSFDTRLTESKRDKLSKRVGGLEIN